MKICKKCGNTIEDDSRYCKYCGSKHVPIFDRTYNRKDESSETSQPKEIKGRREDLYRDMNFYISGKTIKGCLYLILGVALLLVAPPYIVATNDLPVELAFVPLALTILIALHCMAIKDNDNTKANFIKEEIKNQEYRATHKERFSKLNNFPHEGIEPTYANVFIDNFKLLFKPLRIVLYLLILLPSLGYYYYTCYNFERTESHNDIEEIKELKGLRRLFNGRDKKIDNNLPYASLSFGMDYDQVIANLIKGGYSRGLVPNINAFALWEDLFGNKVLKIRCGFDDNNRLTHLSLFLSRIGDNDAKEGDLLEEKVIKWFEDKYGWKKVKIFDEHRTHRASYPYYGDVIDPETYYFWYYCNQEIQLHITDWQIDIDFFDTSYKGQIHSYNESPIDCYKRNFRLYKENNNDINLLSSLFENYNKMSDNGSIYLLSGALGYNQIYNYGYDGNDFYEYPFPGDTPQIITTDFNQIGPFQPKGDEYWDRKYLIFDRISEMESYLKK